MGKVSTATKNKWNAKNYDQLRVIVKKGQKEVINSYAKAQGLSLNGYINKLIEADMKKLSTVDESQSAGEIAPEE